MLQGTPILVLREGTERVRDKSAAANNIAAARAIADAVRTDPRSAGHGQDARRLDGRHHDHQRRRHDPEGGRRRAPRREDAGRGRQDPGPGVRRRHDHRRGPRRRAPQARRGPHRAEHPPDDHHPRLPDRRRRRPSASSRRRSASRSRPPTTSILDRRAPAPPWARRASTAPGTSSRRIAVDAVKKIVEQRGDRTVADVDKIKVEKRHGGTIADTKLIDGIILDKERVHPRMPTRGQGRQDRPPELRPRDQEDRDREQDQDQEPVPDPELPRRGGQDVPEDGRRRSRRPARTSSSARRASTTSSSTTSPRRASSPSSRSRSPTSRSSPGPPAAKIVTGLKELTRRGPRARPATSRRRKVGDDDMTFVTGCANPRSVSILIRGGTEHVTQEVERSLQDALKVVASVLEDGVVCPGGGATEVDLAVKLRKCAPTVGGREQLAVEAFAQALEVHPVGPRRERRVRLDQHPDRAARRPRGSRTPTRTSASTSPTGRRRTCGSSTSSSRSASSARRSRARPWRSPTWSCGSTTSSRPRRAGPAPPGGAGGHDH